MLSINRYDDVSITIAKIAFNMHNNLMREQVSREVESSEQTRKEKMEKKRMIRKNKAQSSLPQQQETRKSEPSVLSRQEKARIQKAKNREAAQKSRDTHRQYVMGLEKEVRQLKEELGTSRKICWKCQRELEEASTHESSSSQQQTDERSKAEPIFSFEKEEEREHCSPFQHFEEESFMRDESNDFPYCKLMLFVCMVAIAVMLASSSQPQNAAPSRALMEIQENKEEVIVSNSSNSTNSTTAIVAVQEKGLIALNNDCINSLMAVEPPEDKRSLRTYHDSPSQNYLASQEGILLCSVRIPKTLSLGLRKLRSPLVKLFLLGSQIKEMLAQSSLLLPVRDSNIQMNGLYRVSAEVKDVSLVTDHSCLL